MEIVILSALAFSASIYILIGLSLNRKNKFLGDIFPILFGRNAKVISVDEFASSATATTISLATIVLAYFELAGYFGIWLLWSVLTTFLGMFILSLVSKRIWLKMNEFKYRPSMHEFLGIEFNSKSVAIVASLCTSIGFLLIFATELIVGSRFLSGLIPQIPQGLTVVFLSGIGFIYTLLGGFRAVIKTDQIQMKFIWGFIIVLGGYYLYTLLTDSTITENISKIPQGLLTFSNRNGLVFFLLGLSIMNIPGYMSNMSMWQRISGTNDVNIVVKGMRKSIWSIIFSWSLLAIFACFAYIFVTPTSNQTVLTDLLLKIGSTSGGKVALFIIVIGLYGAMLSTASTYLIVIGHTISEDIIAKIRKTPIEKRIQSKNEVIFSRIILTVITIIAIFLVEGLKLFGFSIADLIFAIYGGALALFPLIITALYSKRENLLSLSTFANLSVIFGFLSGWGAAIIGKIISNSNLIFFSPGFSLIVSAAILFIGFVFRRKITE